MEGDEQVHWAVQRSCALSFTPWDVDMASSQASSSPTEPPHWPEAFMIRAHSRTGWGEDASIFWFKREKSSTIKGKKKYQAFDDPVNVDYSYPHWCRNKSLWRKRMMWKEKEGGVRLDSCEQNVNIFTVCNR